MTYDSRRAYRLAAVYFVVCWVLAIVTGVTGRLFGDPVVAEGQASSPAWVALVVAAVVVVVIAYGVIWPIGTRSHGRARHWPTVIGFGLLWGISEGQLFASFWAVVSRFVGPDWLVIAVTYLAIAAWNGPWHLKFWDVHVAPLHNIDEWNARKVLFAHTPNLLISLTILTVYENVAIFVGLQTLGLLLSTIVMRFPRYGAPGVGA